MLNLPEVKRLVKALSTATVALGKIAMGTSRDPRLTAERALFVIKKSVPK